MDHVARAFSEKMYCGSYLVCCDAVHEGFSYTLTCNRTHYQVREARFYGDKQIQNRSLEWVVYRLKSNTLHVAHADVTHTSIRIKTIICLQYKKSLVRTAHIGCCRQWRQR